MENKNNENNSQETIVSLDNEQIEKLRQEALKEIKKRHEWRQKGVWLVCKSCKNRHAIWVGINKRLKGINKNGSPILEDKQ